MNKILSKITSAAGKFGKNLTGETVRETKSAAGLHKSMNATQAGSKASHETHNAEFKKTNRFSMFSSKAHSNNLDRQNSHGAGEQGMKDSATSAVPHKSDADVAKAVRDRNSARAQVGGAVAGAALGKAIKNREKKASADNKYLEKIAGMSLGPFGKRVAVGAALGGAAGAVIGGKDNRVKGALAGATAGGVAGSIFGRATRPKVSNVFGPGAGPGATATFAGNASIVKPKMVTNK